MFMNGYGDHSARQQPHGGTGGVPAALGVMCSSTTCAYKMFSAQLSPESMAGSVGKGHPLPFPIRLESTTARLKSPEISFFHCNASIASPGLPIRQLLACGAGSVRNVFGHGLWNQPNVKSCPVFVFVFPLLVDVMPRFCFFKLDE